MRPTLQMLTLLGEDVVGGGGSPGGLVLPHVIHFDDDSLGAIVGWTEEEVYAAATADVSRASPTIVNTPIDQNGNYPAGSQSILLPGHHTTGVGSCITKILAGTIDMSAGFRVAWYMRHAHVTGSQDSFRAMGPLFTKDKTNDFIRTYMDNTSLNKTYMQHYEAQVASLDANDITIIDGDRWHCYRSEFNFAGGSWAHVAFRSGDWVTADSINGAFAGYAGPTDKNILCLSNFGSTSTWTVFDDVHISQIWIGALTDAWPTVGGDWS